MRNKTKNLSILLLTLVTTSFAIGLSNARVHAVTEGSKNVGVTVETTCSFTNESASYSYSLSPVPGTSTDTTSLSDSQKIPFTVACNDLNGFVVKAVGYTGDVEGTTTMSGPDGTIATGTSGANSYWAFRVSSATASGTTVSTNYGAADTWYAVPASATPIASFAATSSGATVTGSVRTDYKVFVASTQPSGTYTGKVKYTILGNS